MSLIYKILGKVEDASSEQTIYAVPDSYAAVVSGLFICNKNAAAKTYTIKITPGGGSALDTHYTKNIDSTDTIIELKGITLSNADVVKVTASHADVKFHLFGVEFPQSNVYVAP